jgi:hypothetical protein
MEILCDELGIEMENIKTERRESGRFNVDIVAEESNSGKKIIIENQLETTDHKHLGQIITYASGHDAEIIIWIVKDFREEHKQAIDWFNNNMGGKILFFLIQIELWQIGNSPFAPKFNIISSPNEWANALKSNDDEFTDLKLSQKEFWDKFKEYASKRNSKLRLGRKTRPQHWYDINYGTSKAHISLTVNSKNGIIGCGIYIPKDKKIYEKYFANKRKITSSLRMKLEWQDLPDKQAFRITTSREGDISKLERWNTYFKWFEETAQKFSEVFIKYT